MSKIAKQGHSVLFQPEDQGGSFVKLSTGETKRLHERNGVYLLLCWVESPNEQITAESEESLFREAGDKDDES